MNLLDWMRAPLAGEAKGEIVPGIDVNLLLHRLLLVAITSAAVFVKNPASQQRAATLLQLAETLADELAPVAPEVTK